jgi:uncharacterized protein YeaO (DUF488 family)
MNHIQIRRVYDPAGPEDGCRLLADRLWPRGISKEKASWERWIKETAPSTELRKSFAHQADRFDEFRTAYRKELDASPEAARLVQECEAVLPLKNITLLYAAKDETHNNAAVLCEWIGRKIKNNNGGK